MKHVVGRGNGNSLLQCNTRMFFLHCSCINNCTCEDPCNSTLQYKFPTACRMLAGYNKPVSRYVLICKIVAANQRSVFEHLSSFMSAHWHTSSRLRWLSVFGAMQTAQCKWRNASGLGLGLGFAICVAPLALRHLHCAVNRKLIALLRTAAIQQGLWIVNTGCTTK